ncbi:MAG TPA: DAK2 domain-containing protein [Bacillota bacterium]|nr:DAK2 domain-containing protein [Candidatus Fermentithermobacillaceae bacterium]HOB30088.1 DAK2 domain-containing protein [Bacillota bacterium]HOK63978.1 DAK2 domain-containing protein [Bacillota bacterium]HOL11333.1 DAK2 domain-containing protein [Bacillota bacterium]HOQ02462.1 DAK2 domain-containing protein [Bacillota bacterium]
MVIAESRIDGDQFIDIITYAKDYLYYRKEEVDALNVFPVPDGDTGTNMYLTLSSAVESLNGMSGISISEASEIASRGALMGARGNSGVILSQILRGIAKGFAGKEHAGPQEVGEAMDEAVITAYKSVMKPVEGTILTVLRGLRDAALDCLAFDEVTIYHMLKECLLRGNEVLEKTPDLLPVLKEAGVVDAGGQGLLYIVEGALEWYEKGHEVLREGGKVVDLQLAVPVVHEEELTNIEYPYDTQLLILGGVASIDLLKQFLEPLGDSLLVVGSGDVVRVHIHTAVPEQVIGVCRQYGSLSDVTIDNMIEQSKTALRSRVQATVPVTVEAKKTISVVSVAIGSGIKAIMKSLGTDFVMDGGITMNPSTSDVAAAVNSMGTDKVIFLPNNPNIFLAARQAKRLTGRKMYIVPSKTIPQGISALLALNLEESVEYNLKRAGKAIRSVKTAEVTFAARDGKFGKHTFRQGDIIGLIDGKVDIVGQDPEEVLKDLMAHMVTESDSLITVYYGHDVDDETASVVYEVLEKDFGSDCDIEVHFGGQPLYYYIVSVE